MAQTYTLDEAAQRLGLPVDEFKRRMKDEFAKIRSFRDGPTLRFRAADIDELARSLGESSAPGLQPGEVGASPLTDSDEPLALAAADDIFSAPPQPKAKGDSDVRLDLAGAKAAFDPEASHPTEEISLDLGGPGSSKVKKGGSSKKLTAAKSGTNLAGPPSAKIPGASGGNTDEGSSEFDLRLDSDSDSFELQLTTDSSEEVDLGAAPPARPGASGINLGKPKDSGVSLEGPKSSSPPPPDSDSDIEFELSLDPSDASAPSLSRSVAQPDSESEFELALDENSGVLESIPDSMKQQSSNDIFETDFDLPAADDDSGSAVVAVDSDTDLDAVNSDFDLAISDSDAPAEDESASQVVLMDDEDVPLVEDDAAVLTADDGAAASRRFGDMRSRGDIEPVVRTVVAKPPVWGPLPAMVLLPTLLLTFLGGLMSFELLRGMWGYSQPSAPGAPVVRGLASMAGMKVND